MGIISVTANWNPCKFENLIKMNFMAVFSTLWISFENKNLIMPRLSSKKQESRFIKTCRKIFNKVTRDHTRIFTMHSCYQNWKKSFIWNKSGACPVKVSGESKFSPCGRVVWSVRTLMEKWSKWRVSGQILKTGRQFYLSEVWIKW